MLLNIFEESALWISVLEVVSAVAALGFGIYGAIEHKRKDKSRVRRIALFGIVISGLISILIKSIGTYNTAQELQKIQTADSMQKANYREEQKYKHKIDSELTASIDTLRNVDKTVQAGSDSTNVGIKLQNQNLLKQKVILNYTQESINPLFPFKVRFHFEIPMTVLGYNLCLRKAKYLRDSIINELSVFKDSHNNKIDLNERNLIYEKYLNRSIQLGSELFDTSYSNTQQLISSIRVSNSNPKYLFPQRESADYETMGSLEIFIVKKKEDLNIDRRSSNNLPISINIHGIPINSTNYTTKQTEVTFNYLVFNFRDSVMSGDFTIDKDFNSATNNGFASLLDLKNTFVILDSTQNGYYLQYMTINTGEGFNRKSRIDFIDPWIKGFKIHKIREDELGIVK
jgi:hypothetical protein